MVRARPQLKRTFGRAMLATERPAPPWGATCRVCNREITHGEPVLFRSWGVEYACASCGWLRPEEREPHVLQGGELRRVFWEWACPNCGRDVIGESQPASGQDLRCPGCLRAA